MRRHRHQLGPVGRHERFVRADNRNATTEKPGHDRSRRLDRAERFDDDIVAAALKCRRVCGEIGGLGTAAGSIDIAHECTDDREANAGCLDPWRLRRQTSDGLPDLTETDNSNADGAQVYLSPLPPGEAPNGSEVGTW